MRFGVCTSFENLSLIAGSGYDYIEPSVAGALKPEQPEEDVMPALRHDVAGAAIRPETYNVFLPGDLKVVGETVDDTRQARYLEAAFARARALGGKVIVFGSGAARGIPAGFPAGTANPQIVQFVRLCGETAARHGLTLAIEPLNRGECNVINSVGEALALAREVAHPSVGVLSDLYHITVEGQTYDETRDAGPLLKHVHVAGQVDRRAPNREDVGFLTGYFRALKATGYDARISVEGSWNDLAAQAAETLDVLHQAWAAA